MSNPANWAVIPWVIWEVTWLLHLNYLTSRSWALNFFSDSQARPGDSSGFTDWGEAQDIFPYFPPAHALSLQTVAVMKALAQAPCQ